MKMYKMNKTVIHNGHKYEKDTQIKETDKGFKEIVGAGHADAHAFEMPVATEEVVLESEEQSAEHSQSGKKPKK